MKIFKDIHEWMRFRKTLSLDKSLGFAPTMGNLHVGHASLFLKSHSENDFTATTLFVNPTQFNNREDFTHYPRTLEQDLETMAESKVDFCILPDEQSMYPDEYRYQIHENHLSLLMEGQHRPGHFQGMLTVVMKLLNLCQPTRAYFGEKDFQQFLLIQGMAKAFFLDVEIKLCPTIREESSLAYSSRNNRLSAHQKEQAHEFAKTFHEANKSCNEIRDILTAQGIQVDYIEEHQGRRYAAVYIGDVRLIDNYFL